MQHFFWEITCHTKLVAIERGGGLTFQRVCKRKRPNSNQTIPCHTQVTTVRTFRGVSPRSLMSLKPSRSTCKGQTSRRAERRQYTIPISGENTTTRNEQEKTIIFLRFPSSNLRRTGHEHNFYTATVTNLLRMHTAHPNNTLLCLCVAANPTTPHQN